MPDLLTTYPMRPLAIVFRVSVGGHGGVVITPLPPASDIGIVNPGPYVEKLVVAHRWSIVYSTEH